MRGRPRDGVATMPDAPPSAIEQEYRRRTPGSARMMDAASASMPHGITRTLSWFPPYPLVFDHCRGASLFDVDGNRYVDLFSNGLSLMHGHAYDPDRRSAARGAAARGSAWPGDLRRADRASPSCCARGCPAPSRSGS